jgi:hypothetical protein
MVSLALTPQYFTILQAVHVLRFALTLSQAAHRSVVLMAVDAIMGVSWTFSAKVGGSVCFGLMQKICRLMISKIFILVADRTDTAKKFSKIIICEPS